MWDSTVPASTNPMWKEIPCISQCVGILVDLNRTLDCQFLHRRFVLLIAKTSTFPEIRAEHTQKTQCRLSWDSTEALWTQIFRKFHSGFVLLFVARTWGRLSWPNDFAFLTEVLASHLAWPSALSYPSNWLTVDWLLRFLQKFPTRRMQTSMPWSSWVLYLHSIRVTRSRGEPPSVIHNESQ